MYIPYYFLLKAIKLTTNKDISITFIKCVMKKKK